MKVIATCCVLVWAAVLGHATIRAQQSPAPASQTGSMTSSIWDGVYTTAQAARGAAVYRDGCARCHGDALQGHDDGAPLAGQDFMVARNGTSVFSLFNKIKLRMPDDDPGSLSGEQTTDVVAYILQVNKVPAGKAELTSEPDRLRQIRFDATKPK